ncbi:MAG TPA: phosphotransferase [Desulfobacteria bacterium]|nr:phosphotransferase [Desulfobacteria bacterium]
MYDKKAIYLYLKREIFPQLAPPPYGRIEMKRLSDERPVYLFRERTKKLKVVGKFFESDSVHADEAWRWAEKGYFNLKHVREKFGMHNGTYRIVAPLGKNKDLAALLVTEMAPGKVLDHYIAKAIYGGESQRLFDKLTYLAQFFVKLHRSSETDKQVSPDLARGYLGKLVHSLSKGPLTSSQRHEIETYAARWWGKNDVFADREVTVHGDATPTNFFFQHDEVIGIDLDKMKQADRCWDLGFLAAELKHHFMWRTGDGLAAEPYIGHFLWEYAVRYRDEQFFYTVTRKIPLYMSLDLLRIARNTWLDKPYRSNLITEAYKCLKYGL